MSDFRGERVPAAGQVRSLEEKLKTSHHQRIICRLLHPARTENLFLWGLGGAAMAS